jgi:hypothetical protein
MDAVQGAEMSANEEAGFCRDAEMGRARHQAPDLRSDFDGGSVRYDVTIIGQQAMGRRRKGTTDWPVVRTS